MLYGAGKRVERESKTRLRRQRNVDGSAFAAPSGRKRKLLSKMGRQLRTRSTATEAVVGFAGRAGRIAAKHHDGFSQTYTAGQARRARRIDYRQPASRDQARALLDAGYRPARRRPTQMWIRTHLSTGQAGLILRELTGERPASSWKINVPARAWMGTNDHDLLLTDAVERTHRRLRRA